MLDQLVGPLVDLWGEDRYSGVAGFIDAQVDIEVQLSGYTKLGPGLILEK